MGVFAALPTAHFAALRVETAKFKIDLDRRANSFEVAKRAFRKIFDTGISDFLLLSKVK